MKSALTVASVLTVWVCIASAQAPPAPQAPAAPAGQPGAPAAGAPAGQGRGGRAPLTPRINVFEASRTSLKPGESFVLSWAAEAGEPTIDNGVGPVYQRGSVQLTPKVTTTYTLTMGNTDVKRSVTVTVAGTTAATAAAPAAASATPTMARINGKPDFSGIYGFTGMSGLGRGAGRGAAAPATPASPYADLPTRPTLKPGVDNTPVPTPAGGTADCMPLPADSAFGVPYPFQVFQNPNYLIIINEYPGTFRIVPIGQPHRADAADDPTWMGDSVGRWEGDTLVIDTVGYNGKHAIGGIQQPSDRFKTIERLTRLNGKDIFYEIMYEDPEKATGPWRANPRTFAGDTRAGVNKVLEFVCENNRDYVPLFGPAGPPAPGAGRGGRGQ